MSKRIDNYLSKRADLERHPIEGGATHSNIDRVIVIPALAERDSLPNMLDSLTKCNKDFLKTTLVLIVVNNRDAEHVSAEAIEENQQTLAWLRSDPYPTLNLLYIDASSPGNELGRKDGVGTARKIGMDHALNILNESTVTPLIICLDADTTVEPNYLDALDAFTNSKSPWAGVINYAHPIQGSPEEQAAIVSYELFLRYTELGLRFASSPYAFHTIGSTIVCTPEAYAAVSGMNRKAAGEDFYFLQQLAKTGSITRITDTTVYPSPRVSWRVPFGTGKRVGRFLDGEDDEWKVYNPESYRILKEWLETVTNSLDKDGEFLTEQSRNIALELANFMENTSFKKSWRNLKQHASNEAQLLKQFHGYFDGFQTLKLLHHLRDSGFPDIDTFEALKVFSSRAKFELNIASDVRDNLDAQIDVLRQLREIS
ncbi:MAG: hypothetical protein VCD00_20325 [Candidatus Hydrogenedentota bacterium]